MGVAVAEPADGRTVIASGLRHRWNSNPPKGSTGATAEHSHTGPKHVP